MRRCPRLGSSQQQTGKHQTNHLQIAQRTSLIERANIIRTTHKHKHIYFCECVCLCVVDCCRCCSRMRDANTRRRSAHDHDLNTVEKTSSARTPSDSDSATERRHYGFARCVQCKTCFENHIFCTPRHLYYYAIASSARDVHTSAASLLSVAGSATRTGSVGTFCI